MLLSIGMIVKNEEKYLDECLNALQPLMKAIESELVIVDTGSTDRTVEIAGKYTDKVFFFEWINDFSAARNFGLEKCSGEWFMYLDADEILEDSKELIDFFRSNKYREYKRAEYIINNIYNLNGDDGCNSFALRLADRNELVFEGKIHEQFSGDNENKFYLKNTTFKHYGYLDEIFIDKIKRNDEYIEKIIETGEFDANAYSYRMGHLLSLEKYEEAKKFAETSREKFDKVNSVGENRIIYYAIDVHLKLNEFEHALDWYKILLVQDLNVVDVMFSLFKICNYCLENNKNNELANCVINILDIYDEFKMFWEAKKSSYLYDVRVVEEKNICAIFREAIHKLYTNQCYDEEIQVLNTLYNFKSFKCWYFKDDIKLMGKLNDFERVKSIYNLVKNTDYEDNFIFDLMDIKNEDYENYVEIIKVLNNLPDAKILLNVLNNKEVPLKIIGNSSDSLKAVYLGNKLKTKRIIKNTQKIIDTKNINNIVGFMIHFDSNFTVTIYDYLMGYEENIETQSDILFFMQLIYYAVAQHSIDDNEKLLWLYLNLVEFTYEYVSNGGDIQKDETLKFLLPYNCKLALMSAENGDMKTAVAHIKEGLKYGNECAYIVFTFLGYIQKL